MPLSSFAQLLYLRAFTCEALLLLQVFTLKMIPIGKSFKLKLGTRGIHFFKARLLTRFLFILSFGAPLLVFSANGRKPKRCANRVS